MKIKFLVVVLIVMVCGGIALLGISETEAVSGSNKQQSKEAANQEDLDKAELKKKRDHSQVPIHVVYYLLFKQVALLDVKSLEEKKAGKLKGDFTSHRAAIKAKLDISDEQDKILDKIALKCEAEIARLDLSAKAIINSAKTKYPDNKVSDPNEFPKVPQELIDLEEQRETAILSYRDEIRQLFGESMFLKFEAMLVTKFGGTIETIADPDAPAVSLGQVVK